MTDHNAHVYAFWNAPLHMRAAWTRGQIEKLEAEMSCPVAARNRGAHDYYALKDRVREYRAGLAKTTAIKLDPMGYWFGCQSN